jgi:hypothetical protein
VNEEIERAPRRLDDTERDAVAARILPHPPILIHMGGWQGEAIRQVGDMRVLARMRTVPAP